MLSAGMCVYDGTLNKVKRNVNNIKYDILYINIVDFKCIVMHSSGKYGTNYGSNLVIGISHGIKGHGYFHSPIYLAAGFGRFAAG
jgi:hypothetical protein